MIILAMSFLIAVIHLYILQECIEIVKDVQDGNLILGFAIGGGVDQDASKNPFAPNDPVSISLSLICTWNLVRSNIFRLTPWEPVYKYIIPGFRPKTSSFRLPYQRHSSSANCARELFKSSKDLASLLVCTWKNIFWLRVAAFCEWRHKWRRFWVIFTHVTWPRAQTLGQCISLKFSLETTLESEYFEPLINFLAFLVQMLWSKTNKLINYLIK